ncbi:MAG: hypothetical protein BRD30_07570 [Bacteroidetes bacterium QH_2_63_10]|nr:MAG: hypothetical protein BRD30_07570 [Bacteroidetes bacterium QH_2_63_10]
MQTLRFSSLFRLALFSVLLLGVGAIATVQAQERSDDVSSEDPSMEEQGAGFFAVGTQFTDLGPLNNRLADAGYPTFASETVSLGGGGYGVVANRLMLGGEGHGLITADGTFEGRTVSVSGGYGLFTVGYLFRPTPKLRVYPQAGLGGGGLQLEIGSTGDADEFDDILENPNRSATVGQASLLVSLGGGLEYRFGEPDGDGGVLLGLRAGYVISALNSDWQLDEDALGGGPDATMQGPFIRLTIGGVGGDDGEDDE